MHWVNTCGCSVKFGGVLHTFSIMPLDTTKPSARTLRVLDHVVTQSCISLASFLKFYSKYAIFTGRGGDMWLLRNL